MAKSKLIYDQPVEVTEQKYRQLMFECTGSIAGCEKDGKFFIKLWIVRDRSFVSAILYS